MNTMRDIVILFSSFLCLCFSLALIKIFHRLWWSPVRLQYLMGLQGIKGPSYRFIHGNNQEMLSIKKEAMAKPMLGLSHDIYHKVQPHIHLWTNLYGKNFIQWYGPQAQFIITEPELIKEILNDRDGVYPKTEINAHYKKKIFGDGLGTSKGEKWVKMRKLANHAFHAESLKGMIPAMVASMEPMLEKWKNHEGKEIEVFEEFRLLTSEIISRTAFGSSYLEGKNIFEMLKKLTFLVSKNVYKLSFPGIDKLIKSEDQIELEKLEKDIRHSIIQIIKKREEKAMEEDQKDSFGNDFLGILLKAHHDANEKQRISVDNVVDECKTFYFAGQETSNTLLTWAVFLLAVHTDWQEEARKEVVSLFGQQIPTPDGITKLKIMSMIINETLRLYPPVIGILRKVEKGVKLGKLILPPNMLLYMSNLAIHHDPKIWGEDVHLFKPERFSEGIAKATKNNIAAYFPFGIGPRTCVGFNFSFTEAKIALAMILQRYSFTLSPTYIHSPSQLITLRPQHGLQVMLHSV
ncbi:cytochrome P450 CYP749A22-like [Ziziphus jujuba]|uniref:Cytochrome P450 CYP749A22-like n=1 Tax=Ziziphus jujuba TaxID=326968 RepID=A0ABM3I1T3_ZIZJJ|nr:cytochrome P450 CYP749A22-like [Ziziphus jujuba]